MFIVSYATVSMYSLKSSSITSMIFKFLVIVIVQRNMEQRTLVVMAAMGLLNICFGLVDSIQVTQFKFYSGDFSPVILSLSYTVITGSILSWRSN